MMLRRLVPLAVLAIALPVWAGWDISDPGTGDPNGVVFSDPLHGIVTAASGSGFVFGGAVGSPIRWSEDGGMNWEGGQMPETLDYALSPCLLAGGKGWCLAKPKDKPDLLLLATTDYGKSWTRQALPENLPPHAVAFYPPAGQQGWLWAGGNRLWSTRDGGQNWGEKKTPPGMLRNYWAWAPADAQHLWLCGELPGKLIIARTADGGETWSKWEGVAQGDGGELIAISMAPGAAPGALGQSGWAIGGEGRMVHGAGGWGQWTVPLVLHTSDGGATWVRQKLPVKPRLTCVWAVSDQEAWVGTFGGYALPSYIPASLMHTTDGGETWRDERPSISSVRGLFWLDKDHGWAVGGQGGSAQEPARILYVWTAGG
jgi:photosystem II stability/assembly factor-like uncharacterized protein